MKPKIVLIAAVDRNGAIGKDNALPWHCPQDLRHFRNLTSGKVILMGRKTADSLTKPLRDRVNLVLTRNPTWSRDGFIPVRSMWDVRRVLKQLGHQEVWVIGGQQVYERFIGRATVVHLTTLDITVDDADAWFPMRGLRRFKGAVTQSCKDPAVQFWTFSRSPVQGLPARKSVCLRMDIDKPTAVWVPGIGELTNEP